MKIFGFLIMAFLLMPFTAHANSTFAEFLQNDQLNTKDNSNSFREDIFSFYQNRNFKPVWFTQSGSKIKDINKYKKIIKNHAYENGLSPQDYNFDLALAEESFNREWMLTNTLMHYIHDIRLGRINPKEFDSKIMMFSQKRNLSETAAKSLSAWNFSKFLETLPPPQVEYKQLRNKLSEYRQLEQKGGFIKITEKAVVYPGETHSIIPQIRKRLEMSFKEYDGKLPAGIWIDDAQIEGEKLSDVIANRDQVKDHKDRQIAVENPEMLYDPTLAKRVAEFQYFHGLKTDGVIGPSTISALNTPVSKRINQIILSMERWRWLPDNLGSKHIRVNIAGYYARAVKNGKDAFVMPIIVGKVAHQTPVFSSVIKNVKIHPDWTSPDSISKRYVIPKIKKDPSVINRLGYEVLDKNTWQTVPWSRVNISSLNSNSTKKYMFRQKPGNKNALGLARFSIENNMSIFMHGTPNESLFNEDDRNFSSGCVRLEDPFKMAYFLLRDEGMSKSKLEELYYLEDGEFPDTTYVDLKKEVPVHLMYMTAWMDQQGNVHFNEDVYNRDSALNKALVNL